MSIFDTLVEVNQVEMKGFKIIMGEAGSGKTHFTKDMPEVAGGDILYIALGKDTGFSQLRNIPGFKVLPKPIDTIWSYDNNGKINGIEKKVIVQINELLDTYIKGGHNFKGVTLDAISTLQELIKNELLFTAGKGLEFSHWETISKMMDNVYDKLNKISNLGHEVCLQSHYQVRETSDSYTNETMSRLLPMMTENNAIRLLRDADAVVFIKIAKDDKDAKKVRRLSIVGGHSQIPTKIRNQHALSFDGIEIENLTYGKLVKLMEISSLEEIDNIDDMSYKNLAEANKLVKKAAPKPVVATPKVETPKVEAPVKKALPKKEVVTEEVSDDPLGVAQEEVQTAPVKKSLPIKKALPIKKEVSSEVSSKIDSLPEADDIFND